jgi:hypothetical protein
VIIGEERAKSLDDKIWLREVVLEKAADGKETLTTTVKVSVLWGCREGGGASRPAARSKKIRVLSSRVHRVNQLD